MSQSVERRTVEKIQKREIEMWKREKEKDNNDNNDRRATTVKMEVVGPKLEKATDYLAA